MTIEFNPDGGKLPPKRRTVTPQGASSPKGELAQKISGKTPQFADPMDAMQKLLDGETDMKTALGFIKSTVPVDTEDAADGIPDASTLTQQLLDGEIDRETFKAGMRALAQQPVPEELEEDASSLTDKLLKGEITREDFLAQMRLLPEPPEDNE